LVKARLREAEILPFAVTRARLTALARFAAFARTGFGRESI
jgi:hypothetical protein